jgi:hypothetical protein
MTTYNEFDLQAMKPLARNAKKDVAPRTTWDYRFPNASNIENADGIGV